MQKHILMYGWEFPPHHSGGLGVACFGLTRALAARGIEVTFVMPKKLAVGVPWAKFVFADATMSMSKVHFHAINSPIKPYETGGGASYGSTASWDHKTHSIYGWDLMTEVLRYAAAGKDIALQKPFDVIYAHDWLSFGAGVAAKKETGKPLIVHVHATEFDRTGGASGVNPDVYAIEKNGMEESDVVITVSEFTKALVMREYGIPENKIRVVHNGIDEATIPQGSGMLPRLRQLKHVGYKIVLFLGRVTLQKGPDYFLRVAKRVTEKNSKILFVLSGSGDMENKMMSMAAELGVSDRVLFTGFIDGPEKHEMYRAADLFVMPSVSEPFGITTLEAMKLGIPVLVSKQSGISEAVQHALKVDFWDVDEMANKILTLVDNPALAESLSANASREAEHLTWNLAAEKVDSIVRELTDSR
jgi:glycogen synthase